MYLMGYAVECTLKARLMEVHRARTLTSLERALSKRHRKTVRLTGAEGHSIARLVELADGLPERIKSQSGTQGDYADCVTWRVEWRYDPDAGTEKDCSRFFAAAERFLRFVDANL